MKKFNEFINERYKSEEFEVKFIENKNGFELKSDNISIIFDIKNKITVYDAQGKEYQLFLSKENVDLIFKVMKKYI